jgi:hypothetical protein
LIALAPVPTFRGSHEETLADGDVFVVQKVTEMAVSPPGRPMGLIHDPEIKGHSGVSRSLSDGRTALIGGKYSRYAVSLRF